MRARPAGGADGLILAAGHTRSVAARQAQPILPDSRRGWLAGWLAGRRAASPCAARRPTSATLFSASRGTAPVPAASRPTRREARCMRSALHFAICNLRTRDTVRLYARAWWPCSPVRTASNLGTLPPPPPGPLPHHRLLLAPPPHPPAPHTSSSPSTMAQSTSAAATGASAAAAPDPPVATGVERPAKITAAELAAHSKASDCWMVIQGKVYDVTDFIDEHPGGDEVMLAEAGKDATEAFDDVGHSDDARALLKPMYKGDLEGAAVRARAHAPSPSVVPVPPIPAWLTLPFCLDKRRHSSEQGRLEGPPHADVRPHTTCPLLPEPLRQRRADLCSRPRAAGQSSCSSLSASCSPTTPTNTTRSSSNKSSRLFHAALRLTCPRTASTTPTHAYWS